MNNIRIEIITPELVIYTDEAHLVNIPGLQGELGIMAGHMNLVVELKPGVVSIMNNAMHVTERFFISEGFAEIEHKSLNIVVETAVNLAQVNAQDIVKELSLLMDKKDFCKDDLEKNMIVRKIEFNQLLLDNLNSEK